MELRFGFDAVADLYEAARPDYPGAVIDDIVGFSGLGGGGRVLEIGCGTGKVTRALAKRGLRVVAIDPGEEMIRVARGSLDAPSDVEFVQTTFEDWIPRLDLFDVVVAAQSLHWVPLSIALPKAASILVDNGAFAIFANVPLLRCCRSFDEFEDIYWRYGLSQSNSGFDEWYLPGHHLELALAGSKDFRSVLHKHYPWTKTHTAQSYTALLQSWSSHALPDPELWKAFASDIARVINSHGGCLTLRYETHLHMAFKSTV